MSQPFGIVRVPNANLLLGDTVLFGIAKESGQPVDFLMPTDELAGFIMPLSSQAFLYSGGNHLSRTESDFINDASIRLSEQFFISPDRSDDLQARVSDIGTGALLQDRVSWEELYEKLRSEYRASDE